MSCFLRAMDFGILKVLGTPILEWHDKWWSFSGYRIEKRNHSADLSVTHRENNIFIEKDHYFITLQKVKNLNAGKQ